MRKKMLLALAAASFVLTSTTRANPYAGTVVSYNPGIGAASGYTDTAAVIGPPSTADSYGDAVDPFDPPWQTNQILSIGAGGWVTVEFDQPIAHYPNTSRDFIIFGNSFFDVTNDEAAFDLWSTEGEVVNDGGQTQVSVSRDGVTFYALNPALAPTANYLYPTDGAGNFQLPVDPALAATNFAGLTLAQIRLLYNGSAGGASYNLAWAQDAEGDPVALQEARFARVDVLTNRVELAGFAAVDGTVLTESFSNNPALDGWETFGDTNLFSWNPASQGLEVTWDSSQANSYFYHPLGTILTSNDAFSLSFDFVLNDTAVSPGTYQYELALGLLNLGEATGPGFLRGTGDNATNVAEFNYFPADGLGDVPSLDATLIDSNGNYSFAYDDVPLLDGVSYHVTIQHGAETSVLTGEIFTNGEIYTTLPQLYNEGTGDFRLDTLAIESYSGADSGSSILAHGEVKNIFLTAPPPPVAYLLGSLTNGNWEVRFWSRINWDYGLEKSSDLRTWASVAPSIAGTGGQLMLTDTNGAAAAEFYRVSANPQ